MRSHTQCAGVFSEKPEDVQVCFLRSHIHFTAVFSEKPQRNHQGQSLAYRGIASKVGTLAELKGLCLCPQRRQRPHWSQKETTFAAAGKVTSGHFVVPSGI